MNPYSTSPSEGGFLWPPPGSVNPVVPRQIASLPYMEYSGMLPYGFPHSTHQEPTYVHLPLQPHQTQYVQLPFQPFGQTYGSYPYEGPPGERYEEE